MSRINVKSYYRGFLRDIVVPFMREKPPVGREQLDEILRREPRRTSPTLRAMQVALGAQAKTLQPA